MKRIAALTAAVTMLVAAPAAVAKTTTYKGDIANGGTIQVKVKTSMRNGKKKSAVTQFKFDGLPVACSPGAGTTSGDITFRTPVKKGKFSIDARLGSAQNPRSQLTAEGKVTKSKASGTIRVHGSEVPLDNGESGNCDSKTSHWSATK